MESLESRILLSGNQAPDPRGAFVGPLPVAPALLVPIPVLPTASVAAGVNPAGGAPLAEAGGAPESVNGVLTEVAAPQIRVLILATDANLDPVTQEGIAGAPNSLSGQTKDLAQVVNLGDIAELPANRELTPLTFVVAGHSAGTTESGLNAASPGGSTDGPAQSDANSRNVVNLPSAPRLEVAGTFNPNDGTVDFRLPVDPLTQSVHLVLRPPPGAANAASPTLGKISLTGPSGLTIAEIEPGPAPDSTLVEDLTVAMENPPEGGQLVVRVKGVPAQQQVAAGSVPPSTFQSNVPFLLDVQRQDRPQSESSSSAATEPDWFGTLAAQSSGQFSLWQQWANPASSGNPSSEVAVSDQPTEIPPMGGPVNRGAEDDGYYVRMATGPLVSRSSGPLGPVLAADDIDPTPPVDRHERALLQEISTLDREEESASSVYSISPRQRALAEREDDSPGPEQTERAVTVVLGAGGFPMKVSSRLSGDRTGLAGLLAALPALDAPPSSADALARSLAAPPDRSVELVSEVSSPANRRGYPDYIKAACGLVLGLGLTSGPLFSDLIASVRKRSPRWISRLRSGRRRDRA
jgi:hypothetical protein